MKNLLHDLGEFWIIQTSGVIPIGEEILSKNAFLEVYSLYVDALKQGKNPENSKFRSYFSAIWTTFIEAVYTVKINEKQCLVKLKEPAVQLQHHRFDYSFADHTFRSMGLGSQCIPWGIQFSFPHLYQDEQLQVWTVKEGERFPNAALFKKIQQWSRKETIATPIEVEGKKINVPIRIGKSCLSWIHHHPYLKSKGLHVIVD